jgi:hypothetical protein
MKKTLLFWCCFAFSIFLVSCSKTDNDVYVLPEQDYTAVKQRFYNMNDNVDIEVLKIVNDIRKHDSVMRFLPSFVAKHGYPVWDKVMFAVIEGNNQRTSEQGNVTTNSSNSRTGSTSNSQGVFFIPMQNETNTAVKSYVTVYKHNDTLYNYRLYDKNDLSTLTPTTDSTKKKLLATQAVFGHFEKVLYNRDSVSINGANSTVIKKAKLKFGTQNGNIGGRDANPQPCVKHVIMFLVVDNVNVGFIIVDVPCPDGGGSGGNGSYSWGGTYCWNCSPGGTNGGNNGGTSNGGGNGGTNWTNQGTGGYGWGGSNWGDPGGASYTGGGGGSGNGNGGTSNQGFSSGYWWTGYSSLSYDYLIPQLTAQLSLIPAQSYWLEQNMPRAIEIANYLQTSLDPDKEDKAKKHLERMIADPEYADFVERHAQQTNYSGKVWWEDTDWLDNPNNFNLDVDGEGAQTYDKLTQAEKDLVKKYPAAAYMISKNKTAAEVETKDRFGDNGLNDKSDAYRHAFFNALNQRDCGKDPSTQESIAKLFSDAHETDTPPQLEKEKQMDLFNNSIGHVVGNVTFPIFTSNNTLSNDVWDKLVSGELRYLKPILPPPLLFPNGQPNPHGAANGDPNYYGAGGIANEQTATHGITSQTQLTPTNL